MWPISDVTVLKDNEEDNSIGFVTGFQYRLPKSVFRPGACSFNEIPNNSVDGKNWGMLTDFVWELIHRLYVESLGRSKDTTADSQQELPDIQIFLESVEAEVDTEESRQKKSIYVHPAFRDDDAESDETLQNFLPGVPNVEIVEYRFWVCIGNSKLDASKVVAGMAKNCEDRTSKHAGDMSKKRNDEEDDSKQTQTYKKWKNIEGLHHLFSLCEFYRGCTFLTTDQIHELAIDNNGEIKNAKTRQALNPCTIFQITDGMQYPGENVCEAQRKSYNYFTVAGSGNGRRLTFPKPANVLKLSPSLFRPASVYNKYFPDFQKLMVVRESLDKSSLSYHHLPRQHSDEKTVTEWNALKNDLQILNEFTSKVHTELNEVDPYVQQSERLKFRGVSSIASEYYELSELHKLRAIGRLDMNAIDKMPSMEQRRTERRDYQDWLFQQFKHNVMHSDSNIGQIGRSLMAGMDKEDLWNFCPTMSVSDRGMTVFANMIANWMMAFEKFMFVVSAHKQLLLLRVGSLDAYRHAFQLHFNALLIGKSNTSKSYVLELIRRLSIEDTTENLTFTTAKSDLIDGNRNDAIDMMEEMPVNSHYSKDCKEPLRESMFKNRLTSCMNIVKTFVSNEDGSRTCRIAKSECIGVWFGATNEHIHMSESMLSRFHMAYFNETHRQGHEVEAFQGVSQRLLGADTQEIEYYTKWFHKLQVQHWLVEKLIMTEGLKDVTLECIYTAITRVSKEIEQQKGNISVHKRIWERMYAVARQLAISTALYKLFYVKGVKVPDIDNPFQLVDNFCGQPFELDQLKYIDPLLFDTEEIANFVILLMEDQIVSGAERKLMQFFKEVNKEKPMEERFKSPSQKASNNFSSTDPEEDVEQAHKDGVLPPKDRDADEQPGFKYVAEMDENEVKDATYCLVSENFFDIKNEVYKRFADEKVKHSTQELKLALNTLMYRTVRGHRYIYDPKTNCPVEDPNSPIENRFCIVKSKDTNSLHRTWAHACLLTESSNSTNNIVMEAIENSLTHKFTLRGWKMLSGEIYDAEQQPHLFKTYTLKPNRRKILKLFNPLFMDNFSYDALIHQDDQKQKSDMTSRKQEYTMYATDNSSHCCMKRLASLSFPIYGENWEKMCGILHPLTHMVYMNTGIADDASEKRKSYPESYKCNYQSRIENMNSIGDSSVENSMETIPDQYKDTSILKKAPSEDIAKKIDPEFDRCKALFTKYAKDLKIPFLGNFEDDDDTMDVDSDSHPPPPISTERKKKKKKRMSRLYLEQELEPPKKKKQRSRKSVL